jgi:hypothetical protein
MGDTSLVLLWLALIHNAHAEEYHFITECNVVRVANLSCLRKGNMTYIFVQKMDVGTRIEGMKLNIQSSTAGSIKISGQECGSTITCGSIAYSSIKCVRCSSIMFVRAGSYTVGIQSCLVYEAIGVGIDGTCV